jgi:hypothetical protein
MWPDSHHELARSIARLALWAPQKRFLAPHNGFRQDPARVRGL